MVRELDVQGEVNEMKLPYELCSDREREERRKAAVRLVMSCKYSPIYDADNTLLKLSIPNIAKTIGVPQSSLYRWVGMEEQEPGAGMAKHKTGPKEWNVKTKLGKEEIEKIFYFIENSYPQDYDLMYALWTRKAIQEFIYTVYGVWYSLNTISKIAKKMNFVLRRPEKFSIKRDDAEIQKYKEEIFKEIVSRALKAGAKIVWCDETHVQQDSTHGRGYSPKGKAARVLDYAATSSHRAFSCFIGVSNNCEMVFTIERGKSDALAFIRFLKEVKKKIKGKVFIIIDNARIHHAKIVNSFVNSSRTITLFYLPTYAPDINPVEYFNNALKTNIRSTPAMTKDELEIYVTNFMNEKAKDKKYLCSFFKAKRLSYINDILNIA